MPKSDTSKCALPYIPIGTTFYKKDETTIKRLWVYIGSQGPTTVGTYRHFFVREILPGDKSAPYIFNLHTLKAFELTFTQAPQEVQDVAIPS